MSQSPPLKTRFAVLIIAYGRETAYAVRCFQSANRLIVDGRAGRYTVAALGGVWEG
ncbi:peptidoglycan-binding domain-containing protein [uncultured Dysosmobacter sp.]|uniref:peptidoglycan-binding domain-containing protein n=1 Tax=uncultured Dysosmobacter sp. TaxID=2591384 RepID=UPI0034306CE2